MNGIVYSHGFCNDRGTHKNRGKWYSVPKCDLSATVMLKEFRETHVDIAEALRRDMGMYAQVIGTCTVAFAHAHLRSSSGRHWLACHLFSMMCISSHQICVWGGLPLIYSRFHMIMSLLPTLMIVI